jgi:hypothetical protein
MELAAFPSQAGAMKRAALLALIVWLTSASGFAQTLVVDLYDYSSLSPNEIERLTETVDLVFAHSGFQIIWQNCRPPFAVRTECGTGLLVNEIVVRILPGGPRSSDDFRILHLGSSIVAADGGNYASVFVPAVRTQAADFGLSFNLLLAYAVAHELGHCLLGPGHSYAGLMRPAWKHTEAGEISRLGLHLTKKEARKATARLSSAGLPVSHD